MDTNFSQVNPIRVLITNFTNIYFNNTNFISFPVFNVPCFKWEKDFYKCVSLASTLLGEKNIKLSEIKENFLQ